ncbi:hypothetical protein [Spirosoma sp. KNUC1025]|uniref:hypothetical protein n=1 Tax=Spirosoma sp. KNUC1025 TaxID=2894082 RepID=UPI003863FAA0|nr:hypothetical protein LN737_25845 [Spirosoma sp. KNUC1025]
MNTVEKQLISLQQQIEHLNAEVATLLALASANQYTADQSTESAIGRTLPERPSIHTKNSQIGINRYRQLQAND